MATKNEITGDSLISKPTTDAYADGWERIFGKKDECKECCTHDNKTNFHLCEVEDA